VTHDQDNGTDRLVSDFLKEFDGLSGSAKRKAVLTDSGLHRVQLSGFVQDGRLDTARIGKLLDAMRTHTKPVRAKRLGLIGEEHLRERLAGMGIDPRSFRYVKKLDDGKVKNGESGQAEKATFIGVPGVLEMAFGKLPDAEWRRIFAGANWSAGIKNPFRTFGHTGEGLETQLGDLRATRSEPVVIVAHLAQPRVEYLDKGKSALVVGEEDDND
jgi:hypothetical protein